MSDAAALRRQLVAIAAGKVGAQEAGGNNLGPSVVEFQRATLLPPGPWPWCAAFVDWCIREWLRLEPVRAALKLRSEGEAETWRPKTALAYGLESWAKAAGLAVLPEHAVARAGDLVTFDFSHVGIVALDQPAASGVVETIEGNTNGAGERDSVAGDGVWRKARKVPLVRRYIRLLA